MTMIACAGLGTDVASSSCTPSQSSHAMMTRDEARSSAGAGGRRRFPRLEVDGTLVVRDLTSGLTMEVRDISFGGLQVISTVPIAPGHEHVLRVALTPVEAHDLRARAIHCRSAARAAGPYIIGWQLAPDIPTARGITAIINRLTDVGSFQPHDTPPQPLSGDR
jgi:hypothetical protein